MGEWQPIETAPKDGSRIILWWNGRAVEGYWFNNSTHMSQRSGWTFCDQCIAWLEAVNPTMWQPMPRPVIMQRLH
jgi:hypothetical protein